MKLIVQEFVEKILSRATYEHDDSVRKWAAWIDEFPGVYAQGNSIEDVRQELASTLEEHVLLSIREGKRIPGLAFLEKSYAKAA